ncbi:hypothetical protein KY345_06320 [Candidatus Woesearchaeota archaeon]|nr:hypothetical protein [Candidatus Woesearchaeota archaeon]
MDEIERKSTQGNTTAYYKGLEMIVEIKGIQVRDESIDVSCTYSLPDGYHPKKQRLEPRRYMSVVHNNTTWILSSSDGKLIRFMPYDENESQEARGAMLWSIAHREFESQSEERLKKTQKLYDFLDAKVNQDPLTQQYLGDFESYITGKCAEIDERSARSNEESERRDQELRRFEDKPDPIDPLLKLVGVTQLCDLLEIQDNGNDEELRVELTSKLGPIIQRFNINWITASISAIKNGRSHRDLEYLKEKGLLRFHREVRKGNEVLYKLTNEGVEAYEVYDSFRKCTLEKAPK